MNKIIIASAVLITGFSVLALAQSTRDCQNMFRQADGNKDGSLQADEAKVFIDRFDQTQVKLSHASMISYEEFIIACRKGAFADIDPAVIE